jgi:hypothetical protein
LRKHTPGDDRRQETELVYRAPGHGLGVVSGNAPSRQGGQDGALALVTVSSSAKAVDVVV